MMGPKYLLVQQKLAFSGALLVCRWFVELNIQHPTGVDKCSQKTAAQS